MSAGSGSDGLAARFRGMRPEVLQQLLQVRSVRVFGAGSAVWVGLCAAFTCLLCSHNLVGMTCEMGERHRNSTVVITCDLRAVLSRVGVSLSVSDGSHRSLESPGLLLRVNRVVTSVTTY